MPLLGKGKKEDPQDLMKHGKFKQAIRLLEEKLKQNPRDFSSKMRLAEAYDGDSRKAEAAQIYAQEAELLLSDGKLGDAASLLKKALRFTPDDETLKARLAQAERTSLSRDADDSSFSFDVDTREATSDQAIVTPPKKPAEAKPRPETEPPAPAVEAEPPAEAAFEIERGGPAESLIAPGSSKLETLPPVEAPGTTLRDIPESPAVSVPQATAPTPPTPSRAEPNVPEIPTPAPLLPAAPEAPLVPEESPALLEEIAQVGEDTASLKIPMAPIAVVAAEDESGEEMAASVVEPLELGVEKPLAKEEPSGSLEETFTNFIAILFPELPADQLAAVRSVSKLRRLERGEVLIREGEEGDSLFILTGGRLEAKGTFGGRELRLAALSPGDILGEVAFLKKVPRTATVTALEPSSVIELQGERTRQELGSHQDLLNQLEVILQDRVYKTLGLLKDAGKSLDGNPEN